MLLLYPKRKTKHLNTPQVNIGSVFATVKNHVGKKRDWPVPSSANGGLNLFGLVH
jgi:hypothetical protein